MRHQKANALINARLGEAYKFTEPLNPEAEKAIELALEYVTKAYEDWVSEYTDEGVVTDAIEELEYRRSAFSGKVKQAVQKVISTLKPIENGRVTSDSTKYGDLLDRASEMLDSILKDNPRQAQGLLFGEGRIQEMRANRPISERKLTERDGNDMKFAFSKPTDARRFGINVIFELEKYDVEASDPVEVGGEWVVTIPGIAAAPTRIKNKIIKIAGQEGGGREIMESRMTERRLERPNDMVHSYLETMLWAETDYNADPGNDQYDTSFDDNGYTVRDVNSGERRDAEKDCKKFLQMAKQKGIDFENDPEALEGHTMGDVGFYFWLNRQGHGVGFWDTGEWPENGDTLDKIAHSFGELYPYSENGEVYT